MNYRREGLRGGGGCCQNKNKSKASADVDKDLTSYRGNVHDFPQSSPQDHDGTEFDDFENAKEKEDEDAAAPWSVTQDDSFTMLTGKYEWMKPEYLEDVDADDEADDFLDKYLLSMSPIVERNQKDQKGKKGTSSRTMPRRPNDVSVKCSESTEEIIGSPSEVALRLNEAIRNYLPRRKVNIEQEVTKEASVALDEEFGKEPEAEPVENLCGEVERPSVPKVRGCPGTYDRMLRENVSCSDALTLREIALGRRIERPQESMLPIDEPYEPVGHTQPISKAKTREEPESCCCSNNKKRETKPPPPPTSKSCCTKQPRTKSVTFTF